jgi:formylglycine-generating enzyme
MAGTIDRRWRKAGPRGPLVVALAASPLALGAFGCDAIYGIQDLSGSDASVTDASVDAGVMDAEASVAADAHAEADAKAAADAPVADAPVDGPSDSGAAGACDGGTRCGGGGVQACDNGTWGTASPCTGSSAFCLNGACVADAPSCADGGAGQSSCGPAHESCCTNEVIDGGTFFRSYDDVTYTSEASPATVSTFRLDRYEVTVGRYRAFVSAYVNGWRPTGGSGKHAHLNGGNGLIGVDSNPPPFGFEPGWVSSDTPDLATTSSGWNTNLLCDAQHQEWTPSPAGNENLPIACETWTEAYAFCIWDGGFLPSEAEWNYAAAGGGGSGGQRVYPWSVPSTDQTIDCTHANLTACVGSASGVGSLSPLGDGAYGHTDMAGNVWEWNLDWFASSYITPCDDCTFVTGATRLIRGGAFDANATAALASYRLSFPQGWRSATFGLRCARAP